jgi:hypothetical protein
MTDVNATTIHGKYFSKYDIIVSTITKINELIPDEDLYTQIKYKLNKIIEDIAYKAPELVHDYWLKLYEIISSQFPIKEDSNEWINEIQTTWNESNIEYSKFIKVQ